jgi:Spy/CpxP family protein refolding chaperone
MKRALTIIGVVVLAAVITIPVMAQGPGAGRGPMMQGYGPGDQGNYSRWGWNENLTDEQRTQLDELHQKFFDETAALRSQMAAKRSELNILMNTSNPDFEKAKALQKEITDLRGKVGQERIKLFAEERKINPDARYGGWGPEGGYGYGPHGRGYGRGMMGYGHGRMGAYGYGRMGGYGPGSCWN